jgi:hypothetical protein
MTNPLHSLGRHDAIEDGSSAAGDDLPLPGYDRLDVGVIIAHIPWFSQADGRRELRACSRQPRPSSTSCAICADRSRSTALTPSNRERSWPGLATRTTRHSKRVRKYERKFHRRDLVLRGLNDARHEGVSALVDEEERP